MSLIQIPVGGDVAAVLPVLLVDYHLHRTRQSSIIPKSYAPANKDFSMPILTLQDGTELSGGGVLTHLIATHAGFEAPATVSAICAVHPCLQPDHHHRNGQTERLNSRASTSLSYEAYSLTSIVISRCDHSYTGMCRTLTTSPSGEQYEATKPHDQSSESPLSMSHVGMTRLRAQHHGLRPAWRSSTGTHRTRGWPRVLPAQATRLIFPT